MPAKKHPPIRVGLVGLGRAGWGMQCGELDRRKRSFKIVAGCDVLPDRLQRLARRYPGCGTYGRIEDLLADDDVELVSIASPSALHVPQTLAALRAGKTVFLEKPIAVTYAGALKLRAAAKRFPGKLFIRHNRRFEPEFRDVMEVIASGSIGEVHEVKLRRNGFAFRDDWQTLRRCGGGQLLNWGPHIIDHGLQILGGRPKSVWSDLKLIAALGDAEDHLKVVMTGRSGCIVDIEISGGAALGEPEWTVYGTNGAIVSWAGNTRLKYLDRRTTGPVHRSTHHAPPMDGAFHIVGPTHLPKWIEKEYSAPARGGTEAIWDALFDTLRRRKAFPITIDQAVEVMRVVDIARDGTEFRAAERLNGC